MLARYFAGKRWVIGGGFIGRKYSFGMWPFLLLLEVKKSQHENKRAEAKTIWGENGRVWVGIGTNLRSCRYIQKGNRAKLVYRFITWFESNRGVSRTKGIQR